MSSDYDELRALQAFHVEQLRLYAEEVAPLRKQRDDWERLARTAEMTLAEADEKFIALAQQRDELRAALRGALDALYPVGGIYAVWEDLLARTAAELHEAYEEEP